MENKEIISDFSVTNNLTKIDALLNKFFIEFNNQKNISVAKTVQLFKNIFNEMCIRDRYYHQ